jgi:hypothetical protein
MSIIRFIISFTILDLRYVTRIPFFVYSCVLSPNQKARGLAARRMADAQAAGVAAARVDHGRSKTYGDQPCRSAAIFARQAIWRGNGGNAGPVFSPKASNRSQYRPLHKPVPEPVLETPPKGVGELQSPCVEKDSNLRHLDYQSSALSV